VLSPILFVIWIPVIFAAAILLAAALVLGAAVGIDEAVRGRRAGRPPVVRPASPALPGLPREAA
jgi:hypothetical protein